MLSCLNDEPRVPEHKVSIFSKPGIFGHHKVGRAVDIYAVMDLVSMRGKDFGTKHSRTAQLSEMGVNGGQF